MNSSGITDYNTTMYSSTTFNNYFKIWWKRRIICLLFDFDKKERERERDIVGEVAAVVPLAVPYNIFVNFGTAVVAIQIQLVITYYGILLE